MRRRAGIAALLWSSLFSTAACGSCVRYADCRLRRDFASCQQGPDCQAFDRCAPGGGPGRCSAACSALDSSCALPSAARHDGCLVDARAGHRGTCIPTDGNPDRCRPGKDPRGYPTCFDTDPPCSGCQMTFDTCIARNHCTGTLCF